MVSVKIGNLFESTAQTWVNTVNCVGIMGKGIALEFKGRFPDMFRDYESRCSQKQVRLGEPYLYKNLVEPWVLNFPTKGHWRAVTNLQDIIRGLDYLLKHYRQWGIQSIAVPPLGCGNGQLEWRVVGPTLYRYLSRMEIPVEIYAPHGTPHAELQPTFLGERADTNGASAAMPEPQFIRPEWIAIVDTVRRLQAQPYHPPVGRTTFQKIAFILTEEGLNTGLEYRRGSYGPFAPELKQVIGRLMNNGLVEERRLGQMLEVRTGSTFEDARRAYSSHLQEYDVAIRRATDLFMRVNTQEAEIVATVIFAFRELVRKSANSITEMDVLDAVMDWKKRRRPPLKSEEVALHIRNLAALGWLQVQASENLPLPEDELDAFE